MLKIAAFCVAVLFTSEVLSCHTGGKFAYLFHFILLFQIFGHFMVPQLSVWVQ